ncbi:uncharacterized protein [Physcomitrium patens]|uniref:Methyltransferase type 11 domain-containing protein n=1 Tax=Physcomitrium patens TaxID=3218 RepID=A9RP09_PHYPA|nr:putative methyltransferase DDB_G0268948 [Physcomitrium patens]PNR35076.1 hypothetical protein PHYPA_022975 [Physcomitrium patens]|eukprot:XP_024403115.1 putative methyltransferase DDB_G0268948 [Physcomitrella patens]
MAALFSKQAREYALARAIYPKSLFSYLASLTPSHAVAWDVGTGSGQAAVQLADHYEKVVATDASKQQIQQAAQRPNITYAVTNPHLTEEEVRTLVGDAETVDLVVCAQALHWFDLDNFYGHVKRVLRRPGGIIAAWTYQTPSVSPAVDAVLHDFNEKVFQDWAPQVRYIEEEYKSISFPFQPVVGSKLTTTGPFQFEATKQATLNEYLTHLRSWSAVQKAIDSGREVLNEQQQKLFADAWGDTPHRIVKWTLYTLIGTL